MVLYGRPHACDWRGSDEFFSRNGCFGQFGHGFDAATIAASY